MRSSQLRRQDDVFDMQGLTRDDITDSRCGTGFGGRSRLPVYAHVVGHGIALSSRKPGSDPSLTIHPE